MMMMMMMMIMMRRRRKMMIGDDTAQYIPAGAMQNTEECSCIAWE